jgi:hypothetical protein
MRIMRIFGAAILTAVIAGPARAQSNNSLQSYVNFLAGHPQMASALSANPSLYRSPAFMNENPSLWSYMTRNPSVYQSVAAKAPAYHPDGNAYALAEYLHSHPQVAQPVNAHPGLVNSPAFLAQHPHFREFLEHHPSVRQRFAERGWDFHDWLRYHAWKDRDKWRDSDDWSDRDWHEQWERQHRLLMAREEHQEEAEERAEREHHDNGKHLGWYKHPDKHHDKDDDHDKDHDKGHGPSHGKPHGPHGKGDDD